MRIDLPALAPNPWFQLCALVAVLSGAATLYNAVGDAKSLHPPPPAPISVVTPAPAPALKAKVHGKWVVDANGAADADSRDLRAVVANLADGDIVTVRPGTYEGGILIAKSARFIGAGADKAAVYIGASARDAVTVTAKSVYFENLTIGVDTPGDKLHALQLFGASHVELNRCVIGSKARFAGHASQDSVLDARDCEFHTVGAGCGFGFENNARGKFIDCAFTSNRWGLQALNAAQVQVASSAFEQNGLPNGGGYILVIEGGQARIDLDRCRFIGNTGTARVSEGGSLAISNSLFKDNGITGEPGNANTGLIGVQNGASATLAKVTFESNKEGVAAWNGGLVTISGCRFSKTGMITDNTSLQFYLCAVSAAGQGSSATVDQGTIIENSIGDAINVMSGARLELTDGTITDSGRSGLVVGTQNGGATVDVRGSHFIRNQTGIALTNGSSGTVRDCQILGSSQTGIVLNGANTKGTLSNVEFRGNGVSGLMIDALAEGSASDCVFDGNVRGAQAGLPYQPGQSGMMTLENCTIANNTICGIAACVNSTVILRGVRFGRNHNMNVAADKGSIVRNETK